MRILPIWCGFRLSATSLLVVIPGVVMKLESHAGGVNTLLAKGKWINIELAWCNKCCWYHAIDED